MVENPIVRALADRARRRSAEPLVTWYSPATGARTELSVKTFANWVDKTANLLDTLGVEGSIAAPLSLDHPGHWMSLVWPLASWQRGCAYLVGDPDPGAELIVTGPINPLPNQSGITIACSLHPLGLGLRDLPNGVLDYTSEALAEPDAHWVTPVEVDATAWADANDERSHADTGLVVPVPGRVLVLPATAWATLALALLGPLLGGGSAVVVEGEVGGEELARIAAAEKATPPVA